MFRKLKQWIVDVYEVWKDEFRASISDIGVVLFFIILPLAYPILYTAIYDPEIVRDIDVVVVDNCRTSDSRLFVRNAGAAENIHIIGYAASMDEARHLMAERQCYGIIEIPENFARCIGRHEQAVVQFYSDATLLIRYRSFLTSLSDVTIQMGAELRQRVVDSLGSLSDMAGGGEMPAETKAVFLGNPQQGFASFVIQAILIFIVQQSLILGVCMIAAGRRERFLRPSLAASGASSSATVFGRMLLHATFYLPVILYIFHFVPTIFNLPHADNLLQFITFMIPMVIATSMLGQVLQIFVKERETSLIIIVFMSVVFLFLSGITWPRFAMQWYWKALGDMIPGVWAVEGFTLMNATGADLGQVLKPYTMMWVLAAAYFLLALILQRRETRRT